MTATPPSPPTEVATAAVAAALARHLPGDAATPISQLRPGGSAYSVGSGLFARVGGVEQQARVLAVAATRSPVPVPAPLFVDAELDVFAYRRLAGTPVPAAELTAHAQALGAFVGRLHGTYVGTVDRVLVTEPPERDDPSLALDLARARRHRLHSDLSVAVRALIDRVLAGAAPPRSRTRAFCHLDLRAEHILTDPATGVITGVLDWGDAAIADPARDLAGVLAHLGPVLFEALVAGYRGGFDADARERAAVFARCLLVAEIEQGIVGGDRGPAKQALRHLQRLV